MKKIVISLVTYNGGEHIQPCLEGIARQTGVGYELVVFDNASSDSTSASIVRLASQAQCIASEQNVGFAAAHNQVMRVTDSDYVCVLNQDCLLEPDYLYRCAEFLDSHPDVASVTGLLIRVPSLTERGPCDTVDAYGMYMTPWAHVTNYRQNTLAKEIQHDQEVIGVSATAAVYRRSALQDVACDAGEVFDEDFFMYKEDVDLALRLRLRRWRAYALNNTRAYHIRTTQPALFSRESQRINEWSYRNNWYILMKDIPLSMWMKNGLWIGLYEWLKFFYLLTFETQTLHVLPDVWKNRKKMLAKRAQIMKRRNSVTDLIPNP